MDTFGTCGPGFLLGLRLSEHCLMINHPSGVLMLVLAFLEVRGWGLSLKGLWSLHPLSADTVSPASVARWTLPARGRRGHEVALSPLACQASVIGLPFESFLKLQAAIGCCCPWGVGVWGWSCVTQQGPRVWWGGVTSSSSPVRRPALGPVFPAPGLTPCDCLPQPYIRGPCPLPPPRLSPSGGEAAQSRGPVCVHVLAPGTRAPALLPAAATLPRASALPLFPAQRPCHEVKSVGGRKGVYCGSFAHLGFGSWPCTHPPRPSPVPPLCRPRLVHPMIAGLCSHPGPALASSLSAHHLLRRHRLPEG